MRAGSYGGVAARDHCSTSTSSHSWASSSASPPLQRGQRILEAAEQALAVEVVVVRLQQVDHEARGGADGLEELLGLAAQRVGGLLQAGARLGVLAGGEIGEAEVGRKRLVQLLGGGQRLARVLEIRLRAHQRG